KASIDPQGDTLNDILIDLAYARHHGKAETPPHRIPLEVLKELSAIVLGDHPDRGVEAGFDILFLKNEVIEAYIHLVAQRVGSQPPTNRAMVPDAYVSPRTKAACRDVLNAAALLHHRDHVERADL